MLCNAPTKKHGLCKNLQGRCHHHPISNIHNGEGVLDVLSTVTKPLHSIPWVGPRIKHTLQGQRTGPTARFTKFLNTTGRQPVVKLEVFRKPVEKPVEHALNALSLGGYEKTKKKLGYKEVYHSYAVVTLADGKKYTIHKNETVQHRESTATDLAGEHIDIPLPASHDFTLRDMVNTAAKTDQGTTASEQSERDFWMYNPRDKNCQDWTGQLVVDNGLHPVDPSAQEFMTKQDSHALVGSLGALSFIPERVTALAATLDRTVYGDGISLEPAPYRLRLPRSNFTRK